MNKRAVMAAAIHQESYAADSKTVFGFWAYLMTDCVLFAALFATYAVLHGSTFGGPTARQLFDLPFVFAETMLLLSSSFMSGLALLAAKRGEKSQVLGWLAVTFVLGAVFVGMEVTEFTKLINEGSGPGRSAFLSAFFTLVGAHGLHITAGLIWMATLAAQIRRRDLVPPALKRLTLFTMFWHFLDVIWIFIFTLVYLMGASL